MLKVPIVMYRAMGCAVMCRAVLNSNVSCRVELCRALLHRGSSRAWRQNPGRTDLGPKLGLVAVEMRGALDQLELNI